MNKSKVSTTEVFVSYVPSFVMLMNAEYPQRSCSLYVGHCMSLCDIKTTPNAYSSSVCSPTRHGSECLYLYFQSCTINAGG